MRDTKDLEKARAALHRAIEEKRSEAVVLRLSQRLDRHVVEYMRAAKRAGSV